MYGDQPVDTPVLYFYISHVSIFTISTFNTFFTYDDINKKVRNEN